MNIVLLDNNFFHPFQDCHVLKLCRFAIVTDTVNFCKMAKKTTEKDVSIIEKLEKELNFSLEQRNIDFNQISEAKQNTKNLTVVQCLRKDLKVLILKNIVIYQGFERCIAQF